MAGAPHGETHSFKPLSVLFIRYLSTYSSQAAHACRALPRLPNAVHHKYLGQHAISPWRMAELLASRCSGGFLEIKIIKLGAE